MVAGQSGILLECLMVLVATEEAGADYQVARSIEDVRTLGVLFQVRMCLEDRFPNCLDRDRVKNPDRVVHFVSG